MMGAIAARERRQGDRHRRQSAQRGAGRRSAPRSFAAAPGAIRDRRPRARRSARSIAALEAGDVLLIAGKGHESGQIVGDRVLEFSDHDAVAAALRGEGRHERRRCGPSRRWRRRWARPRRARCRHRRDRHFRSTPARIAAGRGVLRDQGRCRDGHDFVEAALKAGAGLAVVAASTSAMPLPKDAPLLVGARRAGWLARSGARRARRDSKASSSRVTGSVGKTGTKEALRLALVARRRDACLGCVLQQPLGRAAVARALPARARALRCSKSA